MNNSDTKDPESRSKLIMIGFIPEVMENILLDVPVLQLTLTCRLVCKTWRDIIDNSSALKNYTASGIRPGEGTIENGESRIFTPIAVHFLSMFWKKLAKDLVVYRERDAPHKSVTDHLMRKKTWEVEQEDPDYDDPRAVGMSFSTGLYRAFVHLATMPFWLPRDVIKANTVDKVREHRKANEMTEREKTVKAIFAQFDKPAKSIQLCRKDLEKVPGITLEFDEILPRWHRRKSQLNASKVSNDTGIPQAIWDIMLYIAGVAYDGNFSYKNGTEPEYKSVALLFEQRSPGEKGPGWWEVVKEDLEFKTCEPFKMSVGEAHVNQFKERDLENWRNDTSI
ncbi:hypothetical protein AA313_de0208760 [Arthrobotrys entomopaga]|nr:hypothetical protein AA313_de0208760 [Arthrobotrys entomopaga]